MRESAKQCNKAISKNKGPVVGVLADAGHGGSRHGCLSERIENTSILQARKRCKCACHPSVAKTNQHNVFKQKMYACAKSLRLVHTFMENT